MCATVLLLLLVAGALADPLVVRTTSGSVRGHVDGATSGKAWLGIRYAEAPTGELRWVPPVPAKAGSNEQVMEANEWAPSCPQHCNLPMGLCPPKVSEDCLFLNVLRPRVRL